MREVRWERMFPDELERAFEDCPVVYFAYGLCEPHGPQNALGLDALKAHAIACAAAREHGGIVAPLDCWHVHGLGGYAAWGHKAVGQVKRNWLTCVPPWVHFRNVCYHVRQADALGFHAAILITGHYGPNWQDLKDLLALLQPHVGTRLYGLPDFEANQPGFDGDGKSGGDHAGKIETSLLWALLPECVDMSRVPPEGERGRWGMTAHRHRAIASKQHGPLPFFGPVASGSKQNRAAHGGYRIVDTCSCGATREELRNGGHSEIGPWTVTP